MHPLTRLSTGVVGSLLHAAGFLLGGTAGLAANIGKDNYLNEVMNWATDNVIHSAIDSVDEGLKQNVVPIFSTDAFDDQTTLQKIKSMDASFWGTDVMDTLAFTLSSFVPGGLMSKANTGVKLLKG